MPSESWVFDDYPGATKDHVNNAAHYFTSHHSINPAKIIPNEPDIDFMLVHGREHISTKLY